MPSQLFPRLVIVHAILIVMLIMNSSSFVQAQKSGPAAQGNPCLSPYKNKPVPDKILKAIVESHGQWLDQRYNQDDRRADLCQADLRQAALDEANLERANLEGAILRQANLRQSNYPKRVWPEPISQKRS